MAYLPSISLFFKICEIYMRTRVPVKILFKINMKINNTIVLISTGSRPPTPTFWFVHLYWTSNMHRILKLDQ